MVATRASSFFIFFCFSVAFLFSILALPNAVSYLRPEWVAMVVIYWVIKSPDKVGVVVAWSSGLVLDILEGNLLGVNALSMAVVAYRVLPMLQRIKPFCMGCEPDKIGEHYGGHIMALRHHPAALL